MSTTHAILTGATISCYRSGRLADVDLTLSNLPQPVLDNYSRSATIFDRGAGVSSPELVDLRRWCPRPVLIAIIAARAGNLVPVTELVDGWDTLWDIKEDPTADLETTTMTRMWHFYWMHQTRGWLKLPVIFTDTETSAHDYRYHNSVMLALILRLAEPPAPDTNRVLRLIMRLATLHCMPDIPIDYCYLLYDRARGEYTLRSIFNEHVIKISECAHLYKKPVDLIKGLLIIE